MIQVSQGKNRHASSLATLASFLDNCIPWLITIEMLHKLSINPKVGISIISTLKSSWMDSIIEFLAKDVLLNKVKKVEKV